MKKLTAWLDFGSGLLISLGLSGAVVGIVLAFLLPAGPAIPFLIPAASIFLCGGIVVAIVTGGEVTRRNSLRQAGALLFFPLVPITYLIGSLGWHAYADVRERIAMRLDYSSRAINTPLSEPETIGWGTYCEDCILKLLVSGKAKAVWYLSENYSRSGKRIRDARHRQTRVFTLGRGEECRGAQYYEQSPERRGFFGSCVLQRETVDDPPEGTVLIGGAGVFRKWGPSAQIGALRVGPTGKLIELARWEAGKYRHLGAEAKGAPFTVEGFLTALYNNGFPDPLPAKQQETFEEAVADLDAHLGEMPKPCVECVFSFLLYADQRERGLNRKGRTEVSAQIADKLKRSAHAICTTGRDMSDSSRKSYWEGCTHTYEWMLFIVFQPRIAELLKITFPAD